MSKTTAKDSRIQCSLPLQFVDFVFCLAIDAAKIGKYTCTDSEAIVRSPFLLFEHVHPSQERGAFYNLTCRSSTSSRIVLFLFSCEDLSSRLAAMALMK